MICSVSLVHEMQIHETLLFRIAVLSGFFDVLARYSPCALDRNNHDPPHRAVRVVRCAVWVKISCDYASELDGESR